MFTQSQVTELFGDKQEGVMLLGLKQIIEDEGLWDYFKSLPGPDGIDYKDPNWSRVYEKLPGEHRDSAYAWTSKNLKYIADNGWDAYVSLVLEKRREGSGLLNFVSSLRTAFTIAHTANAISGGNPSPLDVARLARNISPDGEQQYSAMKDFSEGKLTYAQMRALCG